MTKLIVALSLVIAMSASPAFAGEWWENMKLTGDLRYRHEMIDSEGKDARNRHRLRARIGLEAEVNKSTAAVVQLATGSSDPISTNQTLDGAFATKPIGVDLAYLTIKPEFVKGLAVAGGKIKNPFLMPGKSELIWDVDLNPEGGAARFQKDLSSLQATLIGSGLWIDERSSDSDSWLAAGQGVLTYMPDDKKSSIAVGAGYFDYIKTKGFPFFYDSEDPMGNSSEMAVAADDTSFVYAIDYRLVQLFIEGNHQFNEIPVTVVGDFVMNTAADSLKNGWLIGLYIGKTKKPGSWALRYVYRELEKDAVIGAFTDSDFRGGGTDAKGHEIGGDLQVDKNSAFKVSYFLNKIGLNDAESDFSRLQVDLQLKF